MIYFSIDLHRENVQDALTKLVDAVRAYKVPVIQTIKFDGDQKSFHLVVKDGEEKQ